MENENRKFTVLSFVAFAGIIAVILNLLIAQILFALKLGGNSVLIGLSAKQVSLGGACVLGVFTFLFLMLNKTSTQFIDEVFSELRKTTWPNMKETGLSTVVVTVMIGMAALAFFFMDSVWGLFFRTLL